MNASDQLMRAEGAKSFEQGVQMMNEGVVPCAPKPKLFGLFNRPRHKFEDYTHCLNTMTYTTLSRCKDCGLFMLGSGL